MSFWSHIGLSVIDKITDNAFDKLGNALKDGDVKEVVSLFKGILDGVEDKLGDASELFDEAIEAAKTDVRREVRTVKRRLVRETRAELEAMHEQFGDKLLDAMEPKIAAMVEAEVARRMTDGEKEA